MPVEIELRARFDQAKRDELLAVLAEQGEDLGANDKHIYFYVLPDKLLKVVNNVSAGTAKVSLKDNRIGQGSAFGEVEMTIPQPEVDTAVRIFNALGFAEAIHDAVNQRHDFRLDGVEIAVKHSQAWGHHAEFEVLLPDDAEEAAKTDAETRIHALAERLGVRLMTEAELAEFTAAFERDLAAEKAAT